MASSTSLDPTLTRALEDKRQQLAQLQEEIATLERALAILSRSLPAGRLPASAAPRVQPTERPGRARRKRTIGEVVLAAMQASSQPLSQVDMLQICRKQGLNVSPGGVKFWVGQALKKGQIQRVKLGLYTLSSSATEGQTMPASPASPTHSAPSRHGRKASKAKTAKK
ncbi:MAG: hypothetical protein D6690_14745 [Nitrospirae bacterium]|nr:MAG: hypothetical protein D6690_14745 [Nitrospirota bacterium]